METILRRGALIVIEGCDRCGKSTQCKLLATVLQKEGKNIEMLKFPDRSTVIGKMISEYLSTGKNLHDSVVHLLFSANRWELEPAMEKKLCEGTTLIVDRYAYSGVAYTNAKPGFSLDWCKQPDVGLLRPDAVIYLQLPQHIAQQRSHYGDERYEVEEFQLAVEKSFMQLKDETWTVVNADQSIEALHNEIMEVVRNIMIRELPSDIGRLWTDSSL